MDWRLLIQLSAVYVQLGMNFKLPCSHPFYQSQFFVTHNSVVRAQVVIAQVPVQTLIS